MNSDTVFSIANASVLPMWLLMMILPNWRLTRFLVDYRIVPILLALVYVTYVATSFAGGGSFDFGSLDSVASLFTNKEAVLTGWIHYLAFDLLVGMWMVDLNRTLKIHRLVMLPCLLGTFIFGPFGFLLFSLARVFHKAE